MLECTKAALEEFSAHSEYIVKALITLAVNAVVFLLLTIIVYVVGFLVIWIAGAIIKDANAFLGAFIFLGILVQALIYTLGFAILASLAKNYVLKEHKNHIEGIKEALKQALKPSTFVFFFIFSFLLQVLVAGVTTARLYLGAVIGEAALIVMVVVLVIITVVLTPVVGYAFLYFDKYSILEVFKKGLGMLKKWDDVLAMVGLWIINGLFLNLLMAWPLLIVKKYEEGGCVSGDSGKA